MWRAINPDLFQVFRIIELRIIVFSLKELFEIMIGNTSVFVGRMKVKRLKHSKRVLSFYEKNFGFRKPYNILIDGKYFNT